MAQTYKVQLVNPATDKVVEALPITADSAFEAKQQAVTIWVHEYQYDSFGWLVDVYDEASRIASCTRYAVALMQLNSDAPTINRAGIEVY